MKYSNFLEQFSLKNNNGKIELSNSTIATQFHKLLSKCSTCDIDNIKLNGNTIIFKKGFCTSTSSIREEIIQKLNRQCNIDNVTF